MNGKYCRLKFKDGNHLEGTVIKIQDGFLELRDAIIVSRNGKLLPNPTVDYSKKSYFNCIDIEYVLEVAEPKN